MARGGGNKGDDGSPRPQPHDDNAERALLGAALTTPDALETLATRTKPQDFFRPNHQHIAAALTTAFENNWRADPITVADELRRAGLLDQIGGIVELTQLQIDTPSTSSAPRYAEIIHDHATRRLIIGFAGDTADLGYEGSADVHDSIERIRNRLDDVASNNGSRTYSSLHVPELGSFLDGTHVQEEAQLLHRADGKALFYAGKMHVLQAEPSTGKSWIVLKCAEEVLGYGGSVCYLDYEDSPGGITSRLLALRAAPDDVRDRFLYLQPEGPFGLAEKVHLKSLLDRLNPDLIVIDGVAEALARDGYDEDKNADVVKWIEKYPRWLARTGATVVMLDHVAKDAEKRGRHARGAGHKLAAVDGASYEVRVLQSFSRHKNGRVNLVIAKDRPGAVGAIGDTAATVHIEPHADGALVDIRLEPPRPTAEEPWKPTHVMQKVSEELERSTTPLTAAALKMVVASKKTLVETAIARLLAEGFIEEIRHGRTAHLRSVRPYRHDGDPGPDEPPPDPPQPRLTDDVLFDDNPGLTKDELAERRARRDKENPPE